MSDGPYKQLLMNELARLTRIEQHRMLQLVEEKTTDAAPVNQHQITRSPVRIAIAILLQHPEIYKNAEFKALDSQKQRVLKTIIEQIDKNPSISTAQLIELWRDTPIFEAINQLAAWDHQVPDSALLTELIEIVTFIAKQNRESMIQQLMKKTLKEGLSEAERHTLQNMLKQRHQNEPMENSNGIN
jgi:DNA primase